MAGVDVNCAGVVNCAYSECGLCSNNSILKQLFTSDY